MKPSVGNVYFRSPGIYGRESYEAGRRGCAGGQLVHECGLAVAKWLYYDTGSETAAFKALASVYPSDLSSYGDEGTGRRQPRTTSSPSATRTSAMNGKVARRRVGRRHPVPGLAEERHAGAGREPVCHPAQGALHRQRHRPGTEPDDRLPEVRPGSRRHRRGGVRRGWQLHPRVHDLRASGVQPDRIGEGVPAA